ncbi:MAG: lamin tail domain-containing protein, partial [Planctomycetales bacterium]|nr:lamin tail domain-containing protein [Planctomycetales bacterium]
DYVEDGNGDFLERLGYDETDSLYKIYNTFNTASGNEKKAGADESNADLVAVIAGIRQSGANGVNYIMDNVNLARMANFLAGFTITSNQDCCHKNYYAYRDSNGTGEWWFMPWDNDLTQGRNWGGFGLAYFDDTIYPNNVLFQGTNNELLSRLLNNVPGFRDMWLRRIRTLMDDYIKAPGTPQDQLPLENRVAELVAMMKPDADLDNQLNPARWGQTGFQTFDEATQILLNEYAGPRRDFLYNTQTVADPTGMPVLISGEPGTVDAKYFIPSDDSLGRNWTAADFDDTSWRTGKTGIGFELAGTNYTDQIVTNLGDEMNNKTSLYVRIPFQVDDPQAVPELSLRMKYEDGYVAYLNGVEVARKGLRQPEPTFDSTSTTRSPRLAVEYDNINISAFQSALRAGTNVLAIQAINSSATNNDLFVLPELVAGALSSGNGSIPAEQRGNPTVDFGAYEYNPVSGNQQEEFLTLVNNNATSVDISGWRLTGDIEWTFDPGTVLPAGTTLYATPDARAFRARAAEPHGNMQLFVQGNYDGHLPNRGGNVQLVARDGSVVSSLAYTGQTSPVAELLRISEVMYNPISPSAAELAVDNSLISEDFEFIEVVNTSDTETLDLTGVHLANGVEFDFTTSQVKQLAPGERALAVRNTAAFAVRYGQDALSRVAGIFANNTALRDSGERISLLTGDDSIVVDFSYGDTDHQGWPLRADGRGSSLELVDPTLNPSEPTNWRASSEIGGSPGTVGSGPISSIVINEVLSRSVAPQTDSIELFNTSTTREVLQNLYLSDSAASVDSLAQYALPNASIAGRNYLTITEDQFNAGGTGFALNGVDGDEVYLTMGDGSKLTHFVDFVSFDAAAPGETLGRVSSGASYLYPMLSPTLSSTNSPPRVGPLTITEVMYAPSEPSAAALAIDPNLARNDLEFIEIYNPGEKVSLNEWRVRLGVDYDFDSTAELDQGQTLLVVPFNPTNPANANRVAAFRAHYGLGVGVTLVGGYAGQLSDDGEGVRLVRPGAPVAVDDPTIPRLVEDEVRYDNIAPWPTGVATGGLSLQRLTASSYGNDPNSWTAAVADPGVYGGIVVGDLTGDKRVDMADIDHLQASVRTGDLSGDLTGNGVVDTGDLTFLVQNVLGSKIGDVNLDGRFDSHDLVLLFVAGKFEDAVASNSLYREGDFNLDGDFTTADLTFALQQGEYDSGAEAQVAAIAATESLFSESDIAALIDDADDDGDDDVFA